MLKKRMPASTHIEVVYKILKYLLDKNALSRDPSTVNLAREGQPPIYPTRMPASLLEKLDISLIEEAREKGRWWFEGEVVELWISRARWENIDDKDLRLLRFVARQAGIGLTMS